MGSKCVSHNRTDTAKGEKAGNNNSKILSGKTYIKNVN